jgi:hypothetical protein
MRAKVFDSAEPFGLELRAERLIAGQQSLQKNPFTHNLGLYLRLKKNYSKKNLTPFCDLRYLFYQKGSKTAWRGNYESGPGYRASERRDWKMGKGS